jgi:hypothetical protein
MSTRMFYERELTMGNKQKVKTKKTNQTPASRNLDLTEYEFTYKSEPTFVVPLIDFISGLAPIQSPLTKKEKMEQYKNKSRFMREFLSHELVEAFSFNPLQLSKKILELGAILGFKDNISRSVLNDAGIKLNRFYWLVYLTYALTSVLFISGFVFWFFIVPSVPAYVLPSVSPTASLGMPTSVPPTASLSIPTGVSPTASLSMPTSVPPTAPLKVPPIGGVNTPRLVNFSLLFSPISILLGTIFIFIVIRLGILVAGKIYASTLCLLACLYIIFELEQDDILSIDRIKNRLLNRIDFLARYIPLVGLNLSHSDPSVREWTLQYFRTMQKYVRQLERWVIAPKSDTLQVLRKDFYAMAGILLHGNYDEIDWVTETSNIQDKTQTSGQRIGSIIQGFIGIGIPILLLLVVIFYPGIIPEGLGIEKISLIAIAWILIAADVNLRLGVIDRILDVAKAIKELT